MAETGLVVLRVAQLVLVPGLVALALLALGVGLPVALLAAFNLLAALIGYQVFRTRR